MSNDKEDRKVGISKNNNDTRFDHNSPRPPVPGEEQVHCTSDWGLPPQTDWGRIKSSPLPQKKIQNNVYGLPEGDVGYPRHLDKPESSKADQTSSPPCLQWAFSLHRLLEDPDGISLFRRYLESEGRPYADALDFWFACEGLKKQYERERLQQIVKVIYKRFFLKSTLPINDELRKEVGKNLKNPNVFDPPVELFDEAQKQIESLINNTTYPNFLKSDMYLHHIQHIQNPSSSSTENSSESSSSSSSVSARDLGNLASGIGPLPTLHEDMEFVSSSVPLSHTPGTGCLSTGYHTPTVGGPFRLTKDMLLVTQKHRAMDVRPKPEAFAGIFMYRGVGAHAAYNSYNPVSRQDSEMQSVSSHSDVRTESDTMSLTDSSVDGRSLGRTSRRKIAQEARQARQSAALNKETHMFQPLIPRTQRLDTRQCQPMDPQRFAAILTEKLETLLRDKEAQELLDKKLKEGESEICLPSRELANAIREKFQLEDDNDQDILDQHVSRVFSDLTPARSPGLTSPRQHSPSRNRWMQMRPRRKDKDGFSTFSSDSGNVHDFPESLDHKSAMVKSKSMPEYAEERFLRNNANRRSSSKKTLTDLTDSGVSVVSDTPPVLLGGPVKDQSRVLAWLRESDRSTKNTAYTHSEMSAKHRNHRAGSATSPNSNRHRKGYGSRSSSLERNSGSNTVVPAQPFMQDPSIPPLPIPNTAVQLEEARRRLEDDIRSRGKQRSSSKHEIVQSTQSTLRKSSKVQRPLLPMNPAGDEHTTVVFSFCDEQFPYRTKIPGGQVTLKQFKEVLPKKGNYRFFFKTVCEELGNQVIQEEVSGDSDVLPLWEGKIMGQVKAVD